MYFLDPQFKADFTVDKDLVVFDLQYEVRDCSNVDKQNLNLVLLVSLQFTQKLKPHLQLKNLKGLMWF